VENTPCCCGSFDLGFPVIPKDVGNFALAVRNSGQNPLERELLIWRDGFIWSRQDQFRAPGQFTPGEHDAMPAGPTFQPYIRAEAHNRPFIGATWVRFPQPQDVVEF